MTFIFSITLIIVCLLIGGVEASDIFEPYNRFGLSSAYLDSIRSNVLADSSFMYFSLCDFKTPPKARNLYVFRGEDDSIFFNLSLLGSGMVSDQREGFGLSTQFLNYRSKHLNLNFRSDIYTNKRAARMEPKSFETERFITGDEHMSGISWLDFTIQEANLELVLGNFKVLTGKRKKRWGPGHKGTLILSGTSPSPFFFYDANAKLFNRISYSAFFAGLEDEMRFKDDWLVSGYRRVTDSLIPARYMAGHKLDFKIHKNFQASFNEIALLYGSNDITRFFNPIQPIFIGNLRSRTNNANLLISIDYNLVLSPFRYYGEILNDDITAFDETGNPDKFALQQGLVWYLRDGPVKEIGLEYTHIHYYVYGHSRPLTRHVFWGEPMGWPYGNDQDLINLRTRIGVLKNLEIRSEVNAWYKGRGRITDDWYADNRPDMDFLPYWVNEGKWHYNFNLQINYQPWQLLHLRGYYGIFYDQLNKEIQNELQVLAFLNLF